MGKDAFCKGVDRANDGEAGDELSPHPSGQFQGDGVAHLELCPLSVRHACRAQATLTSLRSADSKFTATNATPAFLAAVAAAVSDRASVHPDADAVAPGTATVRAPLIPRRRPLCPLRVFGVRGFMWEAMRVLRVGLIGGSGVRGSGFGGPGFEGFARTFADRLMRLVVRVGTRRRRRSHGRRRDRRPRRRRPFRSRLWN